MSLTPLDETDGAQGEDENSAAERESDGGIAGSFLDGVRSVLGTVVTALRRPFRSSETAVDVPQPRLGEGGHREPATARPVERSGTEVESDSITRQSTTSNVLGALDADEEPDADHPELVATWDESGLTLSEPGDSDARISSDTWTETER